MARQRFPARPRPRTSSAIPAELAVSWAHQLKATNSARARSRAASAGGRSAGTACLARAASCVSRTWRNGCEPHGLVVRCCIRGRDCRRGGCDCHPLAPGPIVAELSHVPAIGSLHVNEPMPRFGMDVDFCHRPFPDRAAIDSHHEMVVGRKGVVTPLLLQREVPVRIEPVRVPRGQRQLPGPVSFGQCSFVGSGVARWGRWAQDILLTRTGRGRRGWARRPPGGSAVFEGRGQFAPPFRRAGLPSGRQWPWPASMEQPWTLAYEPRPTARLVSCREQKWVRFLPWVSE